MIDDRSISAFLQSGEGETLEFKEQWNDAALEALAAFANK
jgi:predicted HTH transcriptional regulator